MSTFEQTERELRPKHGLHGLVHILDIDSTCPNLVRKGEERERSTAHLATETVFNRDFRGAFTRVAKTMLVDKQVHGPGICRYPVLVAPFFTKLDTTWVSEPVTALRVMSEEQTISVSKSKANESAPMQFPVDKSLRLFAMAGMPS